MSGRGRRGGGRGIFGSNRVCGVQRNFYISNNRIKRQEMTFYLNGTRPDRQTEKFTKVREHLILNIQSEFINGSDIAE